MNIRETSQDIRSAEVKSRSRLVLPKLKIDTSGNKIEQGANVVTDRIMMMPNVDRFNPPTPVTVEPSMQIAKQETIESAMQMQVEEDEEMNKEQMKPGVDMKDIDENVGEGNSLDEKEEEKSSI